MSNTIFKHYMAEVSAYKLLTKEEEAFIAERSFKGDEIALNKLVQANLKLVVKIAIQFAKQTNQDVMDLIQEGNFGLMRAAEKFNLNFNTRFSTYATFWIRQSITRYLGNSVRQIRLPMRKEELVSRIKRSISEFQAIYGYKPCYDELAKVMNVPIEKIKEMLECEALNIASLDMMINDEESSSVYDLVSNIDYSPEDDVHKKDILNMIDKILDYLPKLERDILIRRRKLCGYPLKESLYHIGEMFGLSAEGVRQIEARALKRFKSHKKEIQSIAST